MPEAANLPHEYTVLAESLGRHVIDMFFALSGGRMPTDQEADELVKLLSKDSIHFCALENLPERAPIPFMRALLRAMNARCLEISLAYTRPRGTA